MRGQRRGPLRHSFPRGRGDNAEPAAPGSHAWAARLAAKLPGCGDRRPGGTRASLLCVPRSPFPLLSVWSPSSLPPPPFLSSFSLSSILLLYSVFPFSSLFLSLPFKKYPSSIPSPFFLGGPSWLCSFLSCYYRRRARLSKPASPSSLIGCAQIFMNLGPGDTAAQPRCRRPLHWERPAPDRCETRFGKRLALGV